MAGKRKVEDLAPLDLMLISTVSIVIIVVIVTIIIIKTFLKSRLI